MLGKISDASHTEQTSRYDTSSADMNSELALELQELIQKNPSLSLRWRIASHDLPLKQRYYRSLQEYGLSNGVISWVIQHIEWTLPEGSSQEPDGVLVLQFDEKGRACMNIEQYAKPCITCARDLYAYAKTEGTRPADGIDSEVIWTALDKDIYVWTDDKANLSAMNSLVFDLALQKKYNVHFTQVEHEAEFKEQLSRGFEAFLVSDEHGVIQAQDASGARGEFFAQCVNRLRALRK